MALDISDFNMIDRFFGDIIQEMRDDLLRILLDDNYQLILERFNSILNEMVNEKTGIDVLIKKFNPEDEYRFTSLISEIMMGYYLQTQKFPVRFIDVNKEKSPDIKTVISGLTTYVEVKSISRKKFVYDDILKELNLMQLPYDIFIYVEKIIYSASDVKKELESAVSALDDSKITDEFSERFPYKYGTFEIRKQAEEKPVYIPIIGYSIPTSKNDRLESSDSYISKEEIEDKIIDILSDATTQLDSYSNKNDLQFIAIDNSDTNFSVEEFANFLYGGIEVFCPPEDIFVIDEVRESTNNGWNNILYQLGFLRKYMDYQEKDGWFIYSEESKSINGIFYCETRDFKPGKIILFLNPFVHKNRACTELGHSLSHYTHCYRQAN